MKTPETEAKNQEGQPALSEAAVATIRPFDQQTPLERVLRAALWRPVDALRCAEDNLPKHVKREEYSEAANCQRRISEAKTQIDEWNYLLELYEAERQSRA